MKKRKITKNELKESSSYAPSYTATTYTHEYEYFDEGRRMHCCDTCAEQKFGELIGESNGGKEMFQAAGSFGIVAFICNILFDGQVLSTILWISIPLFGIASIAGLVSYYSKKAEAEVLRSHPQIFKRSLLSEKLTRGNIQFI